MRKWILSFMLVVVLGALLVSPVSADIDDSDIPEAIEIIRIINEFRATMGLYPYTFDKELSLASQDHSEWQAETGISDHRGLNGSTERERTMARGYDQGVATFRVDEIIYNGFTATPQKALDFWINSRIDHYPRLVSDVYHEIGVGIAYSDAGRKYYTVVVGMIPGITTQGPPDYTAPTEEEFKGAPCLPVEVAEPEEDGSIYHAYIQGQCLDEIASAYEIPLDTLLLFNNLSASSTPGDGVLLLIQQPAESTFPTVTVTPESTKTPTLQPTSTDEVPAETQAPTQQDPDSEEQPDGAPGTSVPAASTNWYWWVLGILLVGLAAGVWFWYLPTLRKTAQEEGIGLDDWLSDDDKKEDDGREDAHTHTIDITAHGTTTSAFDHLPRKSQAVLLQDVAKRALEAYPLEVISVNLLRYVLNAEFLVEARPQDGGSAKRYVLRVSAPGFHTKAEIASEMEWLDAINRDTKLSVPVPVRTKKGEWVEPVDHPELGIWRHCVLFEYVPSQSIKDQINPKQMEFLGALIALLHKHGERFNPPKGFVRQHWDLEGLKGELLDVPPTQAFAALTEEERQVVSDAEEIVRAGMDALGHGPNVYGLIHGDLHLKSMLFDKGKPVVIDFDTCGYGYYIYDLAVAIWDIFDREDFSELRVALMQGYRKVRQLTAREESLLMNFVAGRLMAQIITWAPRRAHSPLTEIADTAIEKQVEQLKLLIQHMNK